MLRFLLRNESVLLLLRIKDVVRGRIGVVVWKMMRVVVCGRQNIVVDVVVWRVYMWMVVEQRCFKIIQQRRI